MLKSNRQVARAVAAILGTQAAGFGVVAHAADQSDTASIESIQEVVVTAQRRTENAQDVPIAVQVFSGEELAQLNVTNFDDLVKYLPNVTASSQGPGQSLIFMRGLSAGTPSIQSSGSINGFPNVATYLDEQSGQLPGRNLDVYAADLERVEVLEGPQGTLFGAGAQAGVIRYITNKPKLGTTEGSITSGYGTTAGGDPNTNITAVLNVPLIPDTLAVRAVVYDDRRGGYINNVPGTFTRKSTDVGIHYADYPAGCGAGGPVCEPPPGSPVINNSSTVGSAINPVTYEGARLSALWKINDAWDVLVTQSYQDMDAQGVFYEMPYSSDGVPLPKESVTLFNPSYNKDRFENTAIVLNGTIGPLNLVYAGSYLVRNVEAQQDYTNYARGIYADYYQCHAAEPAHGLASTCYSPSTTWNETTRNTHQSHELRLSTPADWRLRGIAGLFWEDLRINDQLNWLYKTMPACSATVQFGCLTDPGPTGVSDLNNPAPIRGDNVAFFNDVKRGYTQRAAFMSVDFDIIPKVLTLTAGTRFYHFDNDEKGAVVGSFGCYEAGLPPCTADATNIDAENLHTTYTGSKGRANLTWHITPDVFVYYTWSQGFRPGAFNRNAACYLPDAQGIDRYCSPLSYASDNLTNNELGWKTEFFDHRLRWNSALYQEDWSNVQVSFFDPGELGNVGFNTNGPTYRIRGFETAVTAVLMQGLTADASADWNSSNQQNSPYLIANNTALLANPASAGAYGKPITDVVNPYGPPGSPAANAPPLEFNLRLRYQWVMSSYNLFAQFGAMHTAHSYTQSGSNPPLTGLITTTLLRFENPAYTTYDASFGATKDAWSAELYAVNLTNCLASTFTSTSQFALQQTTLRPRVIGVNVGYHF
jgi:iron complex outermembrane recepter protein